MNFDKHLFRASQTSLICGGNIGITLAQEKRILELFNEKTTGLNINGNKVKWTDNKNNELTKLLAEQKNPTPPKTLVSELRKIYRAEKHNRYFGFTNKYVQKGLEQEEEAITNYQMYLMSLGKKVFFTKNEVRLKNEFVTGEPDLNPIMYEGKKIGFDIKCSWELETLPFADDELNPTYEFQNQSYMWLTDADEWITAYTLVNIHEHGLNNEKMKWYYQYKCPNDYEDKYFEDYMAKCKELEVRLIFDYDRFVNTNPGHLLMIDRDEWMETINPLTCLKGYDIPLNERIVEKKSIRNDKTIELIKDRVIFSRNYLNNLK